MGKSPEAYINFEVYEDSVNLLGIGKVTLPDVTFLTQPFSGAGIAGNMEAVLVGMLEAMTMTINFNSVTGSATKLMAPVNHNIDLRVAEQERDTVRRTKEVRADKYVMTVTTKSTKPGSVAPASPADASGEYSVSYYAAYKDGKCLWELDPANSVCYIDGVDYMAPVRKALGK